MGVIIGRSRRVATLAACLGALAGVVGLGAPPALAAPPPGTLVTNGSFEMPAIAPGNLFLSSLPGWSELNGCGIEIDRGILGPAFDGNQSIELNSTCASGVSQPVATTPGVTYQLSFAFGARAGTSPADNQMQVTFDGTTVANIGPITPSGSTINWTLYHFDVTATSTSSTIAFKSTDPNTNAGAGAELDDVSLVPPPSASITSPPDGARYALGQTVKADYSCTPGSVLDTCTGPVASGSPINTSHAGTFPFTVTATDTDGLSGSATNTYTVTRAPTDIQAGPLVIEVLPGLSLPLGTASATLTRSDTHQPVARKVILFTLGNSFLCASVTNASGVATCQTGLTGILGAVLNGLHYNATFLGSRDYRGSTTTGPLIGLLGLRLF